MGNEVSTHATVKRAEIDRPIWRRLPSTVNLDVAPGRQARRRDIGPSRSPLMLPAHFVVPFGIHKGRMLGDITCNDQLRAIARDARSSELLKTAAVRKIWCAKPLRYFQSMHKGEVRHAR